VRDFELLEPSTPQEASRMLSTAGEGARLLAGGTAMLLAMRQRLVTPSHVVYLGGVKGLDQIQFDERKGLTIGALTRISRIAESDVIRKQYGVIASMAARMANPQVRNAATIGGNLSYGDPALDPPTCLMALGARVTAVSAAGSRTIELSHFYKDYYTTALYSEEVVTEVNVPPLAPKAAAVYTRFVRTPADHRPLVGIAVVGRNEGGACTGVRIAIGASTPTPVRALKAEQFLEGKKATVEALREAASIASQEIEVISDFRSSSEYRREVVRVVLERTAASVLSVRI
jgi:carbon-monoxide dehydrogenase medium subunit